MAKSMTISPRYGRDYNSQKDVLDALKCGIDGDTRTVLDWTAHPFDGPEMATSIQELRDLGYDRAQVRYAKATKALYVDLTTLRPA